MCFAVKPIRFRSGQLKLYGVLQGGNKSNAVRSSVCALKEMIRGDPVSDALTRVQTAGLLIFSLFKKLEEQDRKALNIKEQLQREHRYLKRRLEQLSVQGMERIRTDSMGSTISTDSEQGKRGGCPEGLQLWEGGRAGKQKHGEDRRDFNPQVEEMLLTSGVAGFLNYRKGMIGVPPERWFTQAVLAHGTRQRRRVSESVLLMFSLEVDIEGMEFTPGEMDSIGSASDAEDHYSLQSGSSDGGYSHSRRLNARLS
ncbi:hypothetical protein CIB84_006010 [Bambusicola thoracicus]|uniref:Uncharacterized protein n=1 Tax=Bambusicola thoracicus TaxID=9083 RepID=A0A2P4T1K9_BAMTH|nr:hypothetical protein CIB84_006010 [Bambusicola thoracicus]